MSNLFCNFASLSNNKLATLKKKLIMKPVETILSTDKLKSLKMSRFKFGSRSLSWLLEQHNKAGTINDETILKIAQENKLTIDTVFSTILRLKIPITNTKPLNLKMYDGVNHPLYKGIINNIEDSKINK
tara:strand:+ start:399 stop:785 length:387 start_codon:yes stop_codon:yes gene_type:complete